MRKSSYIIILTAVLAVISGALLPSCEKYVLPELSFDPDTLYFTTAGGTQTVQLHSNVTWEAGINRSDATYVDWITFTPTFGDGDCEIEVTLPENTSGPMRSLTFDIKSETISHTFTIIQEGGNGGD